MLITTMPPMIVPPNSHHSAVCGFPPLCRILLSIGFRTGSVARLMKLADLLNGLIRRVRTAHEPSAATDARTNTPKTV